MEESLLGRMGAAEGRDWTQSSVAQTGEGGKNARNRQRSGQNERHGYVIKVLRKNEGPIWGESGCY